MSPPTVSVDLNSTAVPGFESVGFLVKFGPNSTRRSFKIVFDDDSRAR